MKAGEAMKIIRMRAEILHNQARVRGCKSSSEKSTGAMNIVAWLEALEVILKNSTIPMSIKLPEVLGFVDRPDNVSAQEKAGIPEFVFLSLGANQKYLNRAVWDLIMEQRGLVTELHTALQQDQAQAEDEQFFSKTFATQVLKYFFTVSPHSAWVYE